jgi:hypothetical protein
MLAEHQLPSHISTRASLTWTPSRIPTPLMTDSTYASDISSTGGIRSKTSGKWKRGERGRDDLGNSEAKIYRNASLIIVNLALINQKYDEQYLSSTVKYGIKMSVFEAKKHRSTLRALIKARRRRLHFGSKIRHPGIEPGTIRWPHLLQSDALPTELMPGWIYGGLTQRFHNAALSIAFIYIVIVDADCWFILTHF